MIFKLICFLSLFVSLLGHAAPKAKSAKDQWFTAQQEFAKLQYSNAYQSAMNVLRLEPSNHEARRLAAKSARELRRYSDCLKLIGDIPVSKVESEDIALTGECSDSSLFSSWTIAFFKQNLSVSRNKDMASYWLGRYSYKKADYIVAKEYLTQVAVLPAKLEKERQFMLNRIKDVLKAKLSDKDNSLSPPPPPSSTANKQPTADKDDDFGSSEPKKPVGPGKPRLQALDLDRKEAGPFFNPQLLAKLSFRRVDGKELQLRRNEQVEFEDAITRCISDVSTTRESCITNANTKYTGLEFHQNNLGVQGRVGAHLGYRLLPSGQGTGVEIGVRGSAGGTLSNSSSDFYTIPGDHPRPQELIFSAPRGWAASGQGVVGLTILNMVDVQGYGGIGIYQPNYTKRHIVQQFGVSGQFRARYVKAVAGYQLDRIFAEGLLQGGQNWEAFVDFNVREIPYFSFRSPDGYPLFRFARHIPVGSQSVVKFVNDEGDFQEFNITPRAHITHALNVFGWYRQQDSTYRSYFTQQFAEQVESQSSKSDDWSAFSPQAQYATQTKEFIAGVEFEAEQAFSVMSGASYKLSRSIYIQTEQDRNQYFKSLLNQEGLSSVSMFLQASIKL